jgi:hypothetical protein
LVRRALRTGRQAPEGKGKYVYCVIKAPEEKLSFGEAGFEGEEVYTMDYRDLAPVVSDVVYREYAVDEEEEVEAHRRVVEQVMREHSVLPVAYGMAFKNRKLLQVAMGAGYQAMQKAFLVVEDKVELGIKVFLPKDLEGWNEAQRAECRTDFLKSLKEKAADSKELKLFSDRLILNAAFLVERARIEEFSEQVSQLVSKYGGAKVQYSGPWPAYNFVDIHILGKKRKGFR